MTYARVMIGIRPDPHFLAEMTESFENLAAPANPRCLVIFPTWFFFFSFSFFLYIVVSGVRMVLATDVVQA